MWKPNIYKLWQGHYFEIFLMKNFEVPTYEKLVKYKMDPTDEKNPFLIRSKAILVRKRLFFFFFGLDPFYKKENFSKEEP